MHRTPLTTALRLLLILAAVGFAQCERQQMGEPEPEPGPDAAQLPVLEIYGENITRKDLDTYIETSLRNCSHSAEDGEINPESAGNAVKSRLFDDFAEEELLVREAVRKGVSVPDEQVDEFLRKLRLGPSAEAKDSRFAGGEIREAVRRDLLVKALVDTIILADVQVSDLDLRDYYEAHSSDFATPEELRFRWLRTRSDERARELYQALRKGRETFRSIAARHPGPEELEIWQDLGFWKREDLPEGMYRTLSTMRPGGLSGVVSNAFGWYSIFELLEVRPAEQRSFPDVRDEILPILRREKGERILHDYIQALKDANVIRPFYSNLGFSYVPRAKR
jgi:peptidyl-prolyl cis-trans isomerase SurA